MSGEQAAYATSGARAKLLLGASLAMVDVFLDVLVLHNFARDHQWKYFGIALGAIVLTSLATWAASNVDFGMVRGSTRDDWPNRLLPRWLKGARLFALVPGVNVVLHAVECLIVGERLRAFAYSRLLEATTEALPQALLQAFVALVDGSTAAGADAHSARLLYLSLGSSIATCAWALVEFEAESNVRFFVARTGAEEGEAAASKAEGGVRSPEERTERALPYRLVLFAARLGEVGARVLALALVGAATDGWALGALVVAEWVGLAAYVARGAHGGGGRRAALASAAAQGCVTSAFFLFARVAPLTPPAGVDGTCAPTLLPYRAYLPIRLLSLAASPIVVAVRYNGTFDLGSRVARFMIATTLCMTALWLLALPTALQRARELELGSRTHARERSVLGVATEEPFVLCMRRSVDEARSDGWAKAPAQDCDA
ncbi:hypothetical protein KFE25_005565 [Diacronema lutheri]|uniref:XK-related protein n=1 Tax=Diacronema lutheri TaxID=2081491 RepID=A0A8J6CDL2_DIALT|nr:hypothetical protein KFE25_005565 [Diacronema lutheri]